MDTDQEYWFCLTHKAVEQRGEFCSTNDRLGPYPSHAEASRALEKVKERNDKWDSEEWN